VSERKYTARLVLTGHIIDSMILPQVMDMIMDLGGNFTIDELTVGQHKTDTSLCRMEVVAGSAEDLDRIVRQARSLGATAESEQPVRTEPVPKDGVFPEGFYSTSNLPTDVLIDGRWVRVENIEMDCAIAVDRMAGRAWCIVFQGAEPGMEVVVGHQGVRVTPQERQCIHVCVQGRIIKLLGKCLFQNSVSLVEPLQRDVRGGQILVPGYAAWLET